MPRAIHFSDDQKSEIVSLYASGLSQRDVALAFSCSQGTIGKVLTSCGVAITKDGTNARISKKAVGRPSHAKGRVRKQEEIDRQKATRLANGKPANVGRVYSAETREKMSAAVKRAYAEGRMPLCSGSAAKIGVEGKKHREAIRQASKRFIHRVLRAKGKKKDAASLMYLGYSTDTLVKHLGEKPTKCAHIDHYVPVAEFLNRGIDCIPIINAIPNLRWLDGKENQKKSASVPVDADAVIRMCRHFAGGVSFIPGIV